MTYTEDEFLLISGIQHFSFCRRQWALIHMEQLWKENLRTVEGKIMHEKCHDEGFTEKRKDLLTTRGMRVFSRTLGAVGQCDVVEFHRQADGVRLFGQEGAWQAIPVEYKRGKPKTEDCDRLQLAAQAMCLEEMLGGEVPRAYLFYDEIRRREEVEVTEALRQEVRDVFREMHDYARRGHTPKAKPKKQCQSCSMKELCLPRLPKLLSVDEYYRRALE
jgi:CRISPR-associated exonuclease Cas4